MAMPDQDNVAIRPTKDHDYLFKIVIIGDSGVGKSSLLLRFADNLYTDSYISTIGVDYRFRTVRYKKKVAKLQIWDTAGQERFRTVTAAYYRGADGIILAYDVSNPKSFAHVKEWLSEVSKYTSENTVKLIVGNKCDRMDKQISTEKGAAFANSMNVLFMESSSKTGANVHSTFNLITHELINKKEIAAAAAVIAAEEGESNLHDSRMVNITLRNQIEKRRVVAEERRAKCAC